MCLIPRITLFRVPMLSWVLCVLLPGAIPSGHSQQGNMGSGFTMSPDEAAACKQNLNQIFEAIQEYRKKYHHLPNWLSELHPEFLDDPKTFICPFLDRFWDLQTWRDGIRFEVFSDPNIQTTYGYEFCAKEYPLWAGFSTTVQEYKKRQQKIIGDAVPILRCFSHRPYLNLSIGGKFYESGYEWESNFKEHPDYRKLYPLGCFDDDEFNPRPGHPSGVIPLRNPNASPKLIDLSNYYNVSLQTSWEWSNPKGKNLSKLNPGLMDLDGTGIQFDVRGLIQLNGKSLYAPYPERVSKIPIRQSGHRLHLLMGTYFGESNGTTIARCELKCTGESTWSIPIIYGEDVLEWWYDPNKEPRSALTVIPAWEEDHGASQSSNYRPRLFHVTKDIQWPEREILTFDFISEMTKSAPFLVALTIE